MWLAVLAISIMALPAQMGTAAIYEAPHYRAPRIQQTGGMPCGGCGDCGVCCESPCEKLTRGVNNALTGWLEVPKNIVTGVFNCNVTPLDGMAVGIGRGFGQAIQRTGVGIYETATFFMPGYGPLMCPEYVSLEPNCMNWRTGTYGSPLCYPWMSCAPCNPYFGPMYYPAPGGMAQQPMRPLPPPSGGAGGAFAPAQPSAAPAAPPSGRTSVTYPDDYLR